MATLLWLTSRSAFERGTQFCPFARYVENHAGNYGYGMQRKAQSMPLVTGSYVHEGIALVLGWVLETTQKTGIQPDEAPAEVIRWAVEVSIEKYQAVIKKRGILTYVMDDPESLAKMMNLAKEQEFLISGLIWAWCLKRLPAYLAEYFLRAVEEEEECVLDCTCGLGERIGTFAEHEARDCQGIGLQSKPDILGQRKSDGKYGYTELKTVSVPRKSWNEAWERKQQFLIGVLGAERRHGVEITHVWVDGLVKGQRKREYPYSDDLPKTQQNCLCYGFYSAGNPPAVESSWRPAFTYRTAEGVEFKALKTQGYRRTALWAMEKEVAFPGCPEEMEVSEYWVRLLHQEYPYHLEKCLTQIGPLPKQVEMVPKAIRSIVAEERLWQERLWRIYEFAKASGKAWGDDEFMEFLETVVPRSWNCDPFGPDHPCPNQYICHPITEDWRDPIGNGIAVPRIPHHEPEKQQVLGRGIIPAEFEGWVDSQEDGGDDDGEA